MLGKCFYPQLLLLLCEITCSLPDNVDTSNENGRSEESKFVYIVSVSSASHLQREKYIYGQISGKIKYILSIGWLKIS